MIGIILIIILLLFIGWKSINNEVHTDEVYSDESEQSVQSSYGDCCTCLDCPLCDVCCDCDDPYMNK